MPLQLWTALLLCLVSIPSAISSALPSIPNPDDKAAFDQILQANLEIQRGGKCFISYPVRWETDPFLKWSYFCFILFYRFCFFKDRGARMRDEVSIRQPRLSLQSWVSRCARDSPHLVR